jgi:hypothetical protein
VLNVRRRGARAAGRRSVRQDLAIVRLRKLVLAIHLDKRREERQLVRMAFGPFAVTTSFGQIKITSPTGAIRFLRSLGVESRGTYHWKVAERMLEVAWTSVDAEALAAQAFKIALETDNLLVG